MKMVPNTESVPLPLHPRIISGTEKQLTRQGELINTIFVVVITLFTITTFFLFLVASVNSEVLPCTLLYVWCWPGL